MKLMKVILHSDVIERFEKLYPDYTHSGYLTSAKGVEQNYLRYFGLFSDLNEDNLKSFDLPSSDEVKQDYLCFLGAIQDLKIIHLVFSSLTMLAYFCYNLDVPDRCSSENHEKCLEYSESGYSLPEELIKEFIYDPRIDLGYCIQCGLEYPIATGCAQTNIIYGKCHPKNFLPFFDKEGNKVFKGSDHYNQEWNPDEFIPYSPEIMEKNRQSMREQRAFQEKRAKAYEARNEPDKAERARKNKIKVF